jgi:hypothetical protein
LLERTRTIRIGYGSIASAGFALAFSAVLSCELGPATLGSAGSEADELRYASRETASVAWPAPMVTIAAPTTIPNRIETTATRISRRTLGAGER